MTNLLITPAEASELIVAFRAVAESTTVAGNIIARVLMASAERRWQSATVDKATIRELIRDQLDGRAGRDSALDSVYSKGYLSALIDLAEALGVEL